MEKEWKHSLVRYAEHSSATSISRTSCFSTHLREDTEMWTNIQVEAAEFEK